MKNIVLVLCMLSEVIYAGPSAQWDYKSPVAVPGFVPNRGQVVDQFQLANNEVQYIYSSGLFNLQLKQNGFSYELFHVVESPELLPSSGFEHELVKSSDHKRSYQFQSSRIDVTFVNASADVQLIPTNATGTITNYYTVNTGNNGITGVQGYYNVTYRDVYPGIDLLFYAPDDVNSALKYEWIIHPDADAASIKMHYDGAVSLDYMADGRISVNTPTGNLMEGKIIAYTKDDDAPKLVSYSIKENVISYITGYKSAGTLVIDPTITWFSYYGGIKNEDLFEGEMAMDGQGSPLIAGNTSSPSNIASTGAHQVIYGNGGVDGFVAKFKSNGNLAWATYYGSYDRDGCHAIAADAALNVFVGGNTFSSSGISTAGSHQEVFGGAMDAFLVKFDKMGIRQWCTYFGGTGYGDQINGVECDGDGDVYFTGYTCSPNNIATPGAYQEVYNGVDDQTGDVMVGAFTNDGTLIWGSYHSGSSQDRAHDIVLLENGDFFVEGTCESTTLFATPGVHQSTYGGGPQDAFISKWSADGQLYWCSYYGGEGDEHGRGLAIDSNNNAYIGGWTISTVGIGTPGTAQPDWFPGYNNEGNPSADAYLAKFTPDGQLAWGTYYGGKDLERSRGIAVDKQNDFIYVAGQTNSKFNVADASLFEPDKGLYLQDGFVSKYNSSGQLIYSYLVGGAGKQTVFDADLDKFNSLYLLMTTDETTYTTTNVHQSAASGGEDAMLVKMNTDDTCYDKYEPNNSSILAAELKINMDTMYYGLNGVISEQNDVDWFRLKTNFTNLKVELLNLLADYDIYLYKSNAQLIATSANIGITDEAIIFNNIPKGKYYLRIIAADTVFDPNSCYRVRALSSPVPWLTKDGFAENINFDYGMQAYIYPNPATSVISIKVASPKEAMLLTTLFDLSGKMIQRQIFPVREGSETFSMDVDELSPGMYLLQTEIDGKRMLTKIVLQ